MRGHKPSPAMIVACVALFVALGGTSIAASRYIIHSTSQIRPSVLRALRGRVGPRGPIGPAGPQGPATSSGSSSTTPSPAEVTFFNGPVSNNGQSQIFNASGYHNTTLTLECSKPVVIVVEVGNGSAWAGTENLSCTHPGHVVNLAVVGAYYRLLMWSAESPVAVTALARFS